MEELPEHPRSRTPSTPRATLVGRGRGDRSTSERVQLSNSSPGWLRRRRGRTATGGMMMQCQSLRTCGSLSVTQGAEWHRRNQRLRPLGSTCKGGETYHDDSPRRRGQSIDVGTAVHRAPARRIASKYAQQACQRRRRRHLPGSSSAAALCKPVEDARGKATPVVNDDGPRRRQQGRPGRQNDHETSTLEDGQQGAPQDR